MKVIPLRVLWWKLKIKKFRSAANHDSMVLLKTNEIDIQTTLSQYVILMVGKSG